MTLRKAWFVVISRALILLFNALVGARVVYRMATVEVCTSFTSAALDGVLLSCAIWVWAVTIEEVVTHIKNERKRKRYG